MEEPFPGKRNCNTFVEYNWSIIGEKTQRGFYGIAISKPAKTRNTTKRYQSGEIIYH